MSTCISVGSPRSRHEDARVLLGETSVREREEGAGKGWESLQTTMQVKEKEG